MGPMLPPCSAQSVVARHCSRTRAAAPGVEPGEREPGDASAGVSSCAREPSWEPWPLPLALLSMMGCSVTVATGEGRAQPAQRLLPAHLAYADLNRYKDY